MAHEFYTHLAHELLGKKLRTELRIWRTKSLRLMAHKF